MLLILDPLRVQKETPGRPILLRPDHHDAFGARHQETALHALLLAEAVSLVFFPTFLYLILES